MGLPLRRFERLPEVFFAVDYAHTTSAAAMGCFEHNRIACLGRCSQAIGNIFYCSIDTPQYSYPDFPGDQPCRNLVAKGFQGFDRRSDKYDPFLPTPFGELGIFREEAITRVNGINVLRFGKGDNFLNIQVIPDRFSGGAHLISFVGLKPVQGISVFVAVNRNRRNAKFTSTAKYTDRNLAPVGYQ